MSQDLTELDAVEVTMYRSPANFAVVEALADQRRVLCLTDDEREAYEIAYELRRRGIRAIACRTVSPK